MNRLTIDIVQDIVDGLTRGGEILSSVFEAGSNRTCFDVCNVFYARDKLSVTLSTDIVDDVFEILTTDQENDKFYVTGDLTAASYTSFQLIKPNYFHNTPMGGSHHFTRIKETTEKFPMVFFFEIFKETKMNDLSSHAIEAQVLIGFIDETKSNLDRDETYDFRIRGLVKLMNSFIDFVKQDIANFEAEETNFDSFNKPKYGLFFQKKGHFSSFFNENMDGVDLSFLLKIKNDCLTLKCNN